MKVFAIKMLFFIVLFFAADLISGRIIGYLHLNTKNINLKNSNYGFTESYKDDVVFFGDSTVSHSFIPEKIIVETGLSSYNFASDGCGIYYQYPLLETILDKHTPKVILISSHQLIESGSDYLSRIYPYYRTNKYVRKIVNKIHPKASIKLLFNGYVYNSKIIRILDSRNDNSLGYVALSPRLNVDTSQVDLKLPQGNNHEISKEVESYFIEFIKKSTSSGSKVYVYIPPALEKINSFYLKKIKNITKNTKAKLIDFSSDNSFLNHKELFNDKIHLNHNGAKVMTDKFMKILKDDLVY